MALPTPYDGSSRPFQIGIKPLNPAEWIEVDQSLGAHLAEKARILAAYPHETFVAEPGTEAVQAELLALLVEHLPVRFPQIYGRRGQTMDILSAGTSVALDADLPPLKIAASLVQEDLVLLRQGEAGWRLAAGALAFPSSWMLREKFGHVMHDIHQPVPGFGAGTRPAQLIERMFDNLRPDMPVIRWNWSLYGDDRLYHPDGGGPRRFGDGERAERVFLRVERQTLRRLESSRDIVFTIRIHVDPLERLEHHGERAAVARALMAQLEGLSDAEAEYKGLTLERPRLLARLSELVG